MMHFRKVKSYTSRQRQLSVRQQTAYDLQWPLIGVESLELLNLETIFHRQAPRMIEIGFGNGDTLWPMALAHPDCYYLGIEIHKPGIANLCQKIIEYTIKNIRVMAGDAVEILQKQIPDHHFSRAHIYFPDPWPKQKHHKRRLISDSFVELLVKKLTPDGIIHCATDWEEYALHMMRVLSRHPALENCAGINNFSDNEKLQLRANTKFETRGVALGHDVWDLVFKLKRISHRNHERHFDARIVSE